MFRKKVAARPLILWILCAMTAPVAQLLAGYDFRELALLSAGGAVVSCIAIQRECPESKVLCMLQALWLLAALWICADFTKASWPIAGNGPVIPLVMLGLAAWAAQKGAATAARMAAILLILLCIGYGLVLGAGILQMDANWLLSRPRTPVGVAIFVLLLPGAAHCLPKEAMGRKSLWLLLIVVFTVLAALAAGGNVYPATEAGTYPFYEMCRSLSLFNLAERFEALMCAMITVGWFAVLTFLLSAFGHMIQKIFPGKAAGAIWAAAVLVAALTLGKMPIKAEYWGIGGGVFWGLVPILTQGIGRRKKIIKTEK